MKQYSASHIEAIKEDEAAMKRFTEESHGGWVLISPDGEVLVGKDLEELTKAANDYIKNLES